MKNLLKLVLGLLFILSISKTSYSQLPTYNLTASNFHIYSDSLTFDIYLLHTNPSAAEFKYAAAQYFFRFNPAIANGGTLTYRIIASGLPTELLPRNPSVSGNELRMASNIISMSNSPLISSVAPGTLIVRMSLKTSATSFSPTDMINLRWRNSNDPPLYTKISAFTGASITEITTPDTHSIDSTVIAVNKLSSQVPTQYKIFQNYPNPFNPVTKIKFDVPKAGNVSIKVFDITGKEAAKLVNEKLNTGSYEYEFNGTNLSSGIYFYRMESNNFVETKKMTLIK